MKQVRLIHLLHTLTRWHSRGIYVVNIHSHLWGAVLFLVLLATNDFFVISRYASASWLDSVSVRLDPGQAHKAGGHGSSDLVDPRSG